MNSENNLFIDKFKISERYVEFNRFHEFKTSSADLIQDNKPDS